MDENGTADIAVDEGAERIYMHQLTELLDRDHRTIRAWVRDAERHYETAGPVAIGITPPDPGILPRPLLPAREGGRKRLYWIPDQLDGLREFAQRKRQMAGWPIAT